MAQSWGLDFKIDVFADSSAALAITARKGNGKLRHVRIGHLWVQQLADSEEVAFKKVRGTCNPADLMTKFLPASKLQPLVELLSQQFSAGHARCRLALDRGVQAAPTGA